VCLKATSVHFWTEIILISQVFGAFLSTDMKERKKHDSEGLTYFGTGECFVFTVRHSPAFFFLNSAHHQRFAATCLESDFVSALP